MVIIIFVWALPNYGPQNTPLKSFDRFDLLCATPTRFSLNGLFYFKLERSFNKMKISLDEDDCEVSMFCFQDRII